MIDVTINSDDDRLPDGTTVDVLVADRTSSPRGVAVAVNGEVVPRSEWNTTALRADDRIELLGASQGG